MSQLVLIVSVAAVAGLLIAVLALGLIALALRAAESDFLPSFAIGPGLVAILLAVPISLCLVTAMTARLTVLKALGKEL